MSNRCPEQTFIGMPRRILMAPIPLALPIFAALRYLAQDGAVARRDLPGRVNSTKPLVR